MKLTGSFDKLKIVQDTTVQDTIAMFVSPSLHPVQLDTTPLCKADECKSNRCQSQRAAFTLIELLVVITVIAILMALLLPAVGYVRATANRLACSKNLQNVGTATVNYHTHHQAFPMGRSKATNWWGQHARILPYLEHIALSDQIKWNESPDSGGNSGVRESQIVEYRCPSDLNELEEAIPANSPGAGRNNYRGNAGNAPGKYDTSTEREDNNGIFLSNRVIKLKDIRDGKTTTVMFSEMAIGDGDDEVSTELSDWFLISGNLETTQEVYDACRVIVAENMTGDSQQASRSGRNWVYGNYTTSRYNHIMRPNSKSCSMGSSQLDGKVNDAGGATTASSWHPTGVNVVMCDGSTNFISEDVDLKVWQSLGSRNGREPISEDEIP